MAAVLAAAPTAAAGQAGTATITGRVVDSAGAGLAGATLLLLGSRRLAETDAAGRFAIRGVAAGAWSVTVRRIGFRPRQLAVTVGRGQVELGNIRLETAPLQLEELVARTDVPRPSFNLHRVGSAVFRPRYNEEILARSAAIWSEGMARVYYALVRLRGRTPFEFLLRRALLESGVAFSDVPVVPAPDRLRESICDGDASPLAVRISVQPNRVLTLDGTGAVCAARFEGLELGYPVRGIPVATAGRLLAAAGAPGGWGVVESNPVPALVYASDAGRRTWSRRLDSLLPAADPDSVYLRQTAGGVILASGTLPFDWVEVDTAGAVIHRSDPFRSGPAGAPPLMSALRDWHGYAVVPVEGGYFQTLEDRPRRHRMIVVYDVLGRPVRHASEGGIPILLASQPAGRRLLGIYAGVMSVPLLFEYTY